MKLAINFYTKENCPLCDDAIEILEVLKGQYPYTLDKRDIYSNDQWLEKYQLVIPVIEIGDQQINAEQINLHSIETFLQEASSKN